MENGLPPEGTAASPQGDGPPGAGEERQWRIGDVAELLQLKTHVLRFWETEFPQLEPLRTESGQRLYTDEHVAMLRRIKNLLHEQGMTIEGAKKVLAGADAAPDSADADFIAHIGLELASICQMLDETLCEPSLLGPMGSGSTSSAEES